MSDGRFSTICHYIYLLAWSCDFRINFLNEQDYQVASSLKKDDRSIPRFVEEIKRANKKAAL